MADDTPEPDAIRWGRADLALARRAARERWGVPDELKTEALFQAARILADPESERRDRLAAAKLLAALDRVDQLDDRLDLERSKLAKPDVLEARDAWQDLHDEMTRDG